MGTLYVVATPIGNLGDMSPRMIEVLRSVHLIACEDTRHSGRLLKHFGIETRLISYHKHNRASREVELLGALADHDVALISDAGTPAIADPGAELVVRAHESGIPVVPVPGPSSLIAAVSASGLVDPWFFFAGFLPRTGTERRMLLNRARAADSAVVFFESPLRLAETLQEMAALFGNRTCTIARELTKMHEEVVRGTLLELHARYSMQAPKGEVVIVVDGPVESEPITADPESLARKLLEDGLKPSRAARELAAMLGMTSAEAYDLVRSLPNAASPESTTESDNQEGGS